jgi:hypothetical protein
MLKLRVWVFDLDETCNGFLFASSATNRGIGMLRTWLVVAMSVSICAAAIPLTMTDKQAEGYLADLSKLAATPQVNKFRFLTKLAIPGLASTSIFCLVVCTPDLFPARAQLIMHTWGALYVLF